MIKKGMTRTVFLTKNYAIKIPNCESWYWFLKGMTANLSEKKWWDSLKGTEYERLLCPIYFSFFGLVLIMPRCRDVENLYTLKVFNALIEDFREISSEVKSENFGYYNNKLVLIDYA